MMGGAPVIEYIRPGVGYAPDAAASMRRLEAALGRPHDCNSSTRDYDLQERMWRAWEDWVAGRGPKPDHSRAVAPWLSKHCMGLADDSDDWMTPGYIELAEEHGWIRTAADDPTERHHFEYQWWRDQHRNDPIPTDTSTTPNQSEEDDMPKNTGHTYPRPTGAPPAQQTWYCIIFNTGSGFEVEMSNTKGQKFDGGFMTSVAVAYDTTSFIETSAEYVDNVKKGLAKVRGD